MNRWWVIVMVVVTSWLGLADSPALESKAPTRQAMEFIARGAAVFSVQCGNTRTDNEPVRLGSGVWMSEWKVAADCMARLEMIRLRRPAGIYDVELLAMRLILTSRSTEPRTLPVVLRLAPSSPTLRDLAFERHAFFVEGQPILVADTPSRGALLADSAFALRPLTPEDVGHVTSTAGECRGELFFDLKLAPGQSQTLGFLAPGPLASSPEVAVTLEFLRSLRIDDLFPAAVVP